MSKKVIFITGLLLVAIMYIWVNTSSQSKDIELELESEEISIMRFQQGSSIQQIIVDWINGAKSFKDIDGSLYYNYFLAINDGDKIYEIRFELGEKTVRGKTIGYVYDYKESNVFGFESEEFLTLESIISSNYQDWNKEFIKNTIRDIAE